MAANIIGCGADVEEATSLAAAHAATVDKPVEDCSEEALEKAAEENAKSPMTRPPEKGLKWEHIMHVRKGDTEKLIAYLDTGADINMKEVSPAGRPLICWASLGIQYECLKILIERGADVNIKDSSGSTALNYVCRLFPDDIRHEAAKLLLSKGADVNLYDNRYFSPLLHGAMTGDVPLLRTLVEAGADIERTDWYFNDAEAFARSKGPMGNKPVYEEAALYLAEVKASRSKESPAEAE